MATPIQVQDVVTYAHVREEKPAQWVDIGLSARTPAPHAKRAILLVRRIDGQSQIWSFAPGAVYWIADAGLFIRGGIYPMIPPI